MNARAGILQPPAVTGAEAVAPTPRLNNAPTFEVFVEQVIDFVTTQGTAAPSSVGNGVAIGASSRPSLEALKSTPVGIWDKRDHVEHGFAGEVACFKRNAISLNLRHVPHPPRVEALIRAMIADGTIHKQWGDGADASALGGSGVGSSLGAEIEGEASGGEAEVLQSLQHQAQDAFEKAKRNAAKDAPAGDSEKPASVIETEALVSALESRIKQRAERALQTPPAMPPGGSIPYTIPPRLEALPAKPAVPTPRTLFDQASM